MSATNDSAKTWISFGRGLPSPDLLPPELADCLATAARAEDFQTLSYGPSTGYPPLREWIAREHDISSHRVVVTNGSLQAFAMFAEMFVGRSNCPEVPTVAVECPSYDLALAALRRTGVDLLTIALDDHGLDVAQFTQVLQREAPPKFLYTIPTFHNPTGHTMSRERRQDLVNLATRHQLSIFEDDPYRYIRFEGPPEPTLFSLEGGGLVSYTSSYSKTVAPGLRVGYVIVPDHMTEQLARNAQSTYVTPGLVAQAAVHEYLRRGLLEAHLASLCNSLKARRDEMLEALDDAFPSGLSWTRPSGGYYIWLTFPEDVEASDVLREARALELEFVVGTEYGGARNSARLAFSAVRPGQIRLGIHRLAKAVEAVRSRCPSICN